MMTLSRKNAYVVRLNSLNDISLTPREVDILACLLSGKSNKSVASFLSVSPRTVDAHLRAIMMKLEGHSREDLIHHVEKSHQYSEFKKHYDQLLLQETFHKIIKDVSQLTTHQKLTCLVNGDHESVAPHLVHQFTDHLKMAGVQVTSKSVIGKGKDTGVSTHGKTAEYKIILRDDSTPNIETIKEEKINEALIFINFAHYKTYYDALFSCLNRLLPQQSLNLNQLLTSFKKQAETLTKEKILPAQQHSSPLPNSFWRVSSLLSYIITIGGGVASIIALCFSLWIHPQLNRKDHDIHSAPVICSELPLSQEQAYLERPTLLKLIDDNYKTQQTGIQIVALVGPGGAGKTTLARHYARSQKYSVVWELNAETRESLLTSLFDLAHALARTSQTKNKLELIKKTQDFREKENYLLTFIKSNLKSCPSWFLIYDNVDNLSDIKEFFPQDPQVWGTGRVILSTRDQTITNTTYINPRNIISVHEFTESDALILVSKILYGQKPDQLTEDIRTDLSRFLKQIPLFPLDVFIAAFYIKSTHISCDQYLDRIKQYNKEFDKNQEALLKNINHYTKTRYGIISASLKKMVQVSPDFKELLLLICLLDSQNIPKSFLESYKETPVVEQFFYNLRKHALITHEFSVGQKRPSHTFSLHRSTQEMGLAFLKNFLSDKEKFEAVNRMVYGIKSFKELNPNIKSFVDFSNAIDCPDRLLLLPHLEIFGRHLEQLNLSEKLKSASRAYLWLLSGTIHYCCTANMLLSQKYLFQFFNQVSKRNDGSIPTNLQALMALVLGTICIDLGDSNQGLVYLQQGLSLVEKISGAEILKSETLRLIGVAYSRNNEFEKSNHFFELAFSALSSVDHQLRKKPEAETYLQLASSYSNSYLNKERANKAEYYILKALEILGASHLFYETKEQDPELLTSTVAKKKERLGEVYNRLGRYQEAITKGLREADYVIDQGHLSDQFFLKAEIDLNMGEAFLREGNLEEAEQRLTNSLKTSEKILGSTAACTWQAKVYRAEVRFRLGKLDLAYEDCASVLNLEQKNPHPYAALLHSTVFYHAAIIKYKQSNFEKAAEHFSDFFKKIKVFCRLFLDNKAYQDLESKMVFDSVIRATLQDLKLCCQHSTSIFSAIYGDSHPFVKKFTLKNAIA